jgi:hypothetical protein
MKDVYFIVEGETELEFVNKLIIPYLYSKGLKCNIQGYPITMSGGGHGVNNIQHFINTITPVLNYKKEPVVTTLIDYFRLNSEKKIPGYDLCMKNILVDDKILCLENKYNEVVQNIKPYRFFLPYIQKHEIETLLFASPEEGFCLESDKIKNAVIEITRKYPDIEDINGNEEGAPSSRLEKIFKMDNKKYDKIIDGIEIAELTGIDNILKKCGRFNNWLDKVINLSTTA